MPPLHLSSSYSYEDMCLAYFDCRKHKRMKESALSFELNFEYELNRLRSEVNSGNYIIGPSRVFVVTYPKAREIWAALFRDRIVHHLVFRDIAPFYEGRFIRDTYSCITGRGTLAAVNRYNDFARKVTQGWSKPAWVIKLDISNFFVSMDKTILWDIIRKDIGEQSLTSELIKQIVFYDPTNNPIISPSSNFSLVPKYKSLWHCSKNNGLAIGNLTSQIFANIYLDSLDKFIKHTLKLKHYVRYVDDFCVLSRDRDILYEYYEQIDEFLRRNLNLSLNRKKTLVSPVRNGVSYLGNIILPYRKIPRKMVIKRAFGSANILRNNWLDFHAFASVNSYLGMFSHQSSYNIRKRICELAEIPTILGYDDRYSKMIRLAA